MKKFVAMLCLSAVLLTSILPGFASAAEPEATDNGVITVSPMLYDGPHKPPIKK